MKYYSELTKEIYDTEKECAEAEEKLAKKNSERKIDADKVEQAYKAYRDAGDAYHQTLADFCKKHGPYHKTYTVENLKDGLDNWLSMIDRLR